MPEISIIVPVFNVKEYINRCIDSILAQTFTDFELIIIDDGSTDGCEKICEEYTKQDDRIKLIRQSNSGQGMARNVGLDIAIGKYIGFIDSDDWITPDMYQHLMCLINTYNADIAEVSYHITKKVAAVPEKTEKIWVFEGVEIIEYYMKSSMKNRVGSYPVVNKLYKSNFFSILRFEKISLGEDYLINFKLLLETNRFVRSSKVCYYYFQRFESSINGKLRKKDFELRENCMKVFELSKNTKKSNIIKLASEKVARCDFSFLAKGISSGISEDISRNDIMQFENNLRRNFLRLIFSSMPINRKFALMFIILNSYIPILEYRVVGNKEI